LYLPPLVLGPPGVALPLPPLFIRQQFIVDVSVYKRDMFIFLDETGGDRRNAVRKRG
jgi:hypothetical protein